MPARRATAACVGTAMADWGAEPEFRGGYTYPSPGCLPLRAALRAPVDRLLFCGEHCTEGLDPCVQAALADGERAARAASKPGAAAMCRGVRSAPPRAADATVSLAVLGPSIGNTK